MIASKPPGLSFAVILAIGMVTSAQAAVLCKKKSGVVVMRDACRKKEKKIDLGQFGVAGPPGTPGAPGAPGSPGAQGPMGPRFIVKDANGTMVGLSEPPGALLMSVNGKLISLGLKASGLYSPGGDIQTGFYYASADCSGQPLYDTNSGPPPDLPPPFAFNFTSRGTLYYEIGPVTACGIAEKNFSSDPNFASWCAQNQGTIQSDGGCCRPPVVPCCPGSVAPAGCSGSGNTFPPWIGLGTLDLTTFVPPFHVEGP